MKTSSSLRRLQNVKKLNISDTADLNGPYSNSNKSSKVFLRPCLVFNRKNSLEILEEILRVALLSTACSSLIHQRGPTDLGAPIFPGRFVW